MGACQTNGGDQYEERTNYQEGEISNGGSHEDNLVGMK